MRIAKGRICSAVLATLLIMGCGGGGGTANTPSGRTPLASAQIQTSIDSSVPINAALSVQTITSSLGIAATGSRLTVPGPSGAEVLVFGVDAQQNVYLLGFFIGQPNLSIDSTAQAIVRIAADAVSPPTGLTTATVNAAVTGSANYPRLTAAISAALLAHQVPTQSGIVLDATWQVAADVVATLNAALPTISAMAVASTSKAQSAVAATPRAGAESAVTASATNIPYYFWDNGADDVPQALAESQLREGHAQILIQTRETLDLVLARVARDAAPEGMQRQMIHHVRENQLSRIHFFSQRRSTPWDRDSA